MYVLHELRVSAALLRRVYIYTYTLLFLLLLLAICYIRMYIHIIDQYRSRSSSSSVHILDIMHIAANVLVRGAFVHIV